MKKVLLTIVEPTTATLLIAFGIGLGIAVHPVFFLAALLYSTIAALMVSLVLQCAALALLLAARPSRGATVVGSLEATADNQFAIWRSRIARENSSTRAIRVA